MGGAREVEFAGCGHFNQAFVLRATPPPSALMETPAGTVFNGDLSTGLIWEFNEVVSSQAAFSTVVTHLFHITRPGQVSISFSFGDATRADLVFSQEPHAPLAGEEATFTIMKAQKFTIWQARGKLVTVLPQSRSHSSSHATEVGPESNGQATFNVGH
ncbi:hypothetical protein SCLCIDRAFT_23814 [Scleroderma citrinum Foug A]|uniref:Uncharacterized protein n=1 Tax=Scleroderma citrinum Foug A TaxID=1036808 RepID=A0A0C2ZQP9_9AGAM|nr:hypothetical protein SCLCIDRAFT_23814 [Scleroderma citrinum Foug A]